MERLKGFLLWGWSGISRKRGRNKLKEISLKDSVIPAQAGIPLLRRNIKIPAFAGMTAL